MKPGDNFNETDDDVLQEVVTVHPKSNPPIARCRSIKSDNESSETEQEYDLQYVSMCVSKLKEFVKKGYSVLDAKALYKLNAKQLQDALFLAKQKCTGTKTELRQRLCSYLQITEITTSCESGSEEEDSEDVKMYCLTEDSIHPESVVRMPNEVRPKISRPISKKSKTAELQNQRRERQGGCEPRPEKRESKADHRIFMQQRSQEDSNRKPEREKARARMSQASRSPANKKKSSKTVGSHISKKKIGEVTPKFIAVSHAAYPLMPKRSLCTSLSSVRFPFVPGGIEPPANSGRSWHCSSEHDFKIVHADGRFLLCKANALLRLQNLPK